MDENTKVEDFGLVPWDADFGTNYSQNKSSSEDYIRLQDGSNLIRIVTPPYQYWCHKYKEREEDPGFGASIKCSLHHGECPLCDKKIRRTRRWLIGVIDRRTSSYKILDMSRSVCQDIQTFSQNKKWGDPGKYDVDIVKNRKAGPQGYYTVVPEPPTPLSQNDLHIKTNDADEEDLQRRVTPPTPDRVQARIDFINKKNAEKRSSQERPAAVPAAVPAADPSPTSAPDPQTVAEPTPEDEEFNFTSVN